MNIEVLTFCAFLCVAGLCLSVFSLDITWNGTFSLLWICAISAAFTVTSVTRFTTYGPFCPISPAPKNYAYTFKCKSVILITDKSKTISIELFHDCLSLENKWELYLLFIKVCQPPWLADKEFFLLTLSKTIKII